MHQVWKNRAALVRRVKGKTRKVEGKSSLEATRLARLRSFIMSRARARYNRRRRCNSSFSKCAPYRYERERGGEKGRIRPEVSQIHLTFPFADCLRKRQKRPIDRTPEFIRDGEIPAGDGPATLRRVQPPSFCNYPNGDIARRRCQRWSRVASHRPVIVIVVVIVVVAADSVPDRFSTS